ncbi:MAG: hypothetical protein CL471_01575 [Acidobacteria bacterium]|jgi:hypothetical protein|nr:hypothetical protein [Acidobacteriota bacterium]|tara:strand:- start:9812 stop:12076 length:2265 start_codon:yes stop_codon:yes gene_type:complete
MSNLFFGRSEEADVFAPASILGVEVTRPNGSGRVWLEGSTAPTMLYGKAGSGASDLIEALRGLFGGMAVDAMVRCFVRLPDTVLGGPAERDYELTALSAQALGVDEDVVSGAAFQEAVSLAAAGRSWRGALAAPVAAGFREFCRDTLLNETDLMPVCDALGLPLGREEIGEIITTECQVHGRPWQEVALLWLALTVAYEGGVGETPYAEVVGMGGSGGLPIEAMRELAASRIVCLSPNGVDRPSWSLTLAARLSDETPALVRLRDETRRAFLPVVRQADPSATSSCDLVRLCGLIEGEWQENWREAEAPSRLLAGVADLPWLLSPPEETTHPYISANHVEAVSVDRPIPGWPRLVELDRSFDIGAWVRSRMEGLFRSSEVWPARSSDTRSVAAKLEDHFDWASDIRDVPVYNPSGSEDDEREPDGRVSVAWSGPSADRLDLTIEFPALERLSESATGYGEQLKGLGVGLGGLRLRLAEDLSSWMVGVPASLEALDEASGSWVAVEDLSEPQKSLVCMAIRIGEETEATHVTTPVFIANGSEEGIGSDISALIQGRLAELPGPSYVSSGSPVAIRSSMYRLLHVSRSHDGSVTVERADLAGDPSEVATRLGVDLADVLASKDLVVVVDRPVDGLVVEELMRGEPELGRLLIKDGCGLGIAELMSLEVLDLRGSDLVGQIPGATPGGAGSVGAGAVDVEHTPAEVRKVMAGLDELPGSLVDLHEAVLVAAGAAGFNRWASSPVDVTGERDTVSRDG